ncbi:hypothetical protein C7N43_10130 [Sphingobacteriales bacterium UPWRP_1]|nr:hypothetical protein B6N25_12235 [Sphingobacteriales bacterium TSM_CSS]PSJ77180.1 hypothetical protein C7N43_10130 [Sphingobacteriales bacterium UPWRP_1]
MYLFVKYNKFITRHSFKCFYTYAPLQSVYGVYSKVFLSRCCIAVTLTFKRSFSGDFLLWGNFH